jgi:hypothetical protein
VIRSVRRLVHVLAAAALAAGALAVIGVAPASAAGSVGYVIAQGEGECWLASVDLVSGITTQIGTPSPEKCAFDLEFTPDGTRLLGTRVDEGEIAGIAHLLEFDLTTGVVTDLGQLGDFEVDGPGSDQGNLALPASGGLFTYLVPGNEGPIGEAVDPACDGSAFCLFQGDAATPGSLTYVNSVPQTFTVYYGLATSCGDVTSSVREVELADAASFSSPTAAAEVPQILTTVNRTATGPGTTDVGPVGDGVFLTSVDYDTAGTLHAVGFEPENVGPSIFTVDTATGAATQITTLKDDEGPINVGVLGFAIAHPCTTPPPPAPPEPPAAQPIAAVTPRFTG